MKVDKEYGTISEGKYADIIAVKGDVLRYINLLSDVKMVIKHGIKKWKDRWFIFLNNQWHRLLPDLKGPIDSLPASGFAGFDFIERIEDLGIWERWPVMSFILVIEPSERIKPLYVLWSLVWIVFNSYPKAMEEDGFNTASIRLSLSSLLTTNVRSGPMSAPLPRKAWQSMHLVENNFLPFEVSASILLINSENTDGSFCRIFPE